MMIGIFLGSVRARHKQFALKAIHATAARQGVNANLFSGDHYQPCDVAVIWGFPKPEEDSGKQVRREIEIRNRIVQEHRGIIIYIDAPLLGRKVVRTATSSRLAKVVRTATVRSMELFRERPLFSTSNDHSHFRIGINGGFNDDGGFGLYDVCQDRWARLQADLDLTEPKPYRASGDHILLIGQVPNDASLRGTDIIAWLIEQAKLISSMTERKLVIRPHPLMREESLRFLQAELACIPSIEIDTGFASIRQALNNAWATVTLSSGASIDSLFEGVPVIATSSASPAYEVADHDVACIEYPTLYDRGLWLNKLASCQWSREEFKNGAVWDALARTMKARG